MLTRRTFLGSSAAFAAAIGSGALAAEPAPFDMATFEAAQAAGKPIVVAISAPWCPICKAQKPIIAKLGADPRFRDLTIFDIDFDTQKDAVRQLNARSQSTLIAYKGKTEVGRSIGETQPEWIEAFFEKTL